VGVFHLLIQICTFLLLLFWFVCDEAFFFRWRWQMFCCFLWDTFFYQMLIIFFRVKNRKRDPKELEKIILIR